MTTPPGVPIHDDARALPRRLLAPAWLVSAAAVGSIGWLLTALAERTGDRASGIVLTTVAVFGAVAGVGVLRAWGSARALSLTSSGLFVAAGLGAGAVAATADRVFAADVVAQGVVPVAAGVVTALLVLRAPRR